MTLRAGQDRHGLWWVTNNGHYLVRSDNPTRYIEEDERVPLVVASLEAHAGTPVALTLWPTPHPAGMPFPTRAPFPAVRFVAVDCDGHEYMLFDRGDGTIAAAQAVYVDAVTDQPLEAYTVEQLGDQYGPIRFSLDGNVAAWLMPCGRPT